jgi:hypothetical protein
VPRSQPSSTPWQRTSNIGDRLTLAATYRDTRAVAKGPVLTVAGR